MQAYADSHESQYGPAPAQPHADVTQAILSALKGIRYGSVEIIIHDAKVVQIERKEKFRFEKEA